MQYTLDFTKETKGAVRYDNPLPGGDSDNQAVTSVYFRKVQFLKDLGTTSYPQQVTVTVEAI